MILKGNFKGEEMTNRGLVHRFWVDYKGGYSELVKEFEEAFENRWVFDAPIEEVTPKNKIFYNDCEISIKRLTHKSENHISYLSSLDPIELELPDKEASFAIDFNSFYMLDTPKTRRQLRKVAESIPGGDAILSIDNLWVSGIRKDGVWSWNNEKFLPDLARYKPKESIDSRQEYLDDLWNDFTWFKRSMFDPYLIMPFNKMDRGYRSERLDWKIYFDGTLDELYKLFSEQIDSSQEEYKAYQDFDKSYYEFTIWRKKSFGIEALLQTTENFVLPENILYESNTYMFTYNREQYVGDGMYQNQIIEDYIDELIKHTGLKAIKYLELNKILKTYDAEIVSSEGVHDGQ